MTSSWAVGSPKQRAPLTQRLPDIQQGGWERQDSQHYAQYFLRHFRLYPRAEVTTDQTSDAGHDSIGHPLGASGAANASLAAGITCRIW